MRKYDSAGNEVWTRQVSVRGSDTTEGVTVDGMGNVYVAGSTRFPFVSNSDAFVRKYDPAGNEAWTLVFGSGFFGGSDGARAVAADGMGNVHVVGFVTDGALPGQTATGSQDAFVSKYNSAGSELWTRQFGSAGRTEALGVAVDGTGNVYVAGHNSLNLPGQISAGGFDAFVRKYDSAGNELWTRQFGSAGDDRATGVAAADGAGNVYVAGFNPVPGQNSWESFVRKYDSAGNEVWTRQFGSAPFPPGYERPTRVALDGAGNVYVAGSTVGALPGQTAAGDFDAFVRKYDSAGTEVWTRQLANAGVDEAKGVAVDSTGNVYMAGDTNSVFPGQTAAGGLDVFIAKLSQNQPPTADAGGPYTVAEGGTVTLTGSGSDPDGNPLTYAWDLDNNGTFETPGQNVTFSAGGSDGPGSQIVVLKVCDNQDACATSTATVNITNVAPTATFAAPSPINDGDSSTLMLTQSSDPSSADTNAGFRYSFACNGLDASLAASYAAAVASNTASCVFADNGSFTVKGRIFDKDNGFNTYQAIVVVNNVAPTVGVISAPTAPVQVNTAITTSAGFTDPGVQDTHTAVWNWGDGTTSAGTVTETNGSGSVTGSHTYTAAGVYTVTLTVTDDDGGSGQSVFQYVVVFDPAAGFITGAGSINSPPGAYVPNPSLTGPARFGFVSRYQNGATVPTGQTGFHFLVANFHFRSTAYAWLVIGGARAQYRGTGTINGAGSYDFILTGIDGEVSGGGGLDKFRIKIFGPGGVVYDNQMGAGDDAVPTTVITSGNIVIHR